MIRPDVPGCPPGVRGIVPSVPGRGTGLPTAIGIASATAAGAVGGTSAGSPFATDLSAFAGLAAGRSRAFAATLDSAALGTFASGLTLAFADENLRGAASLGGLSLSTAGLPAAAVPEPATGAVLLLAGAGGLLRRRRNPSRPA